MVDWVRRQPDPRAALGSLVTRWWPTDAATRPELARGSIPCPADLVTSLPDPAVALGGVRERLLDAGERAAGAVFTPPALAGRLVREAFLGLEAEAKDRRRALDWSSIQVLDPAVGGGAFLLAAHDELRRRGVGAAQALTQLWGVDVDDLSVAVTEAALGLRAGGALPPGGHLVVGDLLGSGGDAIDAGGPGAFDLVVGNPPFQSQLATRTARSTAEAARLRARFGPEVVRYLDTAAVFLLAAWSRLAEGGVVGLVVPQSVLSASDAAGVRARLDAEGRLCGLWLGDASSFDAAVHTCVPFVVRSDAGDGRGGRRPVRLLRGNEVTLVADVASVGDAATDHARSWAEVAGDVFGVPVVPSWHDQGRLGDLCDATAGFRDQFYGLRGSVRDAAGALAGDAPRLCTSGLIDPARLLWGVVPARFDGTTFEAPVIDLEQLDRRNPEVAAWGTALLRPKVLVASQTRVVEAVVDRAGDLWPSVPTVAVLAEPDALDLVLAVLLAPPTTAWAHRRAAGAALAPDALRLPARAVLEIPLPQDRTAWSEAAAMVREEVEPAGAGDDPDAWRGALERFGACMCRAYAADAAVLAWWTARLPRHRHRSR